MTSGTLAYSFGLGKAVVSTPYWHARELLADGRGILVPFGDAAAIGSEIAGLLTDDPRREAMRKRAYASSRSMTWARTAERYLTAFESARRGHRLRVIARLDQNVPSRDSHAAPEMRTRPSSVDVRRHRAVPACGPFRAGSCSRLLRRRQRPRAAVGLRAQRSGRAAPARGLDGPLRRLRPACVESGHQAVSQLHELRSALARRRGSEDSHGRTLWALGECARSDASASRRRWAAALFAEALPPAESFSSPRAWAFTLLGLDAYCAVIAEDSQAERVRQLLAERLMSILSAVETQDWVWFEEGLAYDNARLPQALIVTGRCDRNARLCRRPACDPCVGS